MYLCPFGDSPAAFVGRTTWKMASQCASDGVSAYGVQSGCTRAVAVMLRWSQLVPQGAVRVRKQILSLRCTSTTIPCAHNATGQTAYTHTTAHGPQQHPKVHPTRSQTRAVTHRRHLSRRPPASWAWPTCWAGCASVAVPCDPRVAPPCPSPACARGDWPAPTATARSHGVRHASLPQPTGVGEAVPAACSHSTRCTMSGCTPPPPEYAVESR